MKKKELESARKKEVAELIRQVQELKKKAAVTSANMQAGREKNLKAVKKIRREVAQLATIITEKEKSQK